MKSISDTTDTANVGQSSNGSGGASGGKAALVVRVKRRRSTSITDIPQQICVTQSSSGSKGGLASLSLSENRTDSSEPSTKRYRSVVLDLVSTVDPSLRTTSESDTTDSTPPKDVSENDIDASTFSAVKQKRKRLETESLSSLSSTTGNVSVRKPTQFLYLTDGKKTVTDNQDGSSLLIVDMSIRDGNNTARATLTPNQIKTSSGNVATKIISPITRLALEPALNVYTQNFDFVPVLDALSQGADINHQVSSRNGMTALMVTSQMVDPRSASKLISMGANVHSTDMDGRNALDYAIEAKTFATTTATKDATAQLCLLLQHATNMTNLGPETLNGNENGIKDNENEYVTDIYCVRINENNVNKSSELIQENIHNRKENIDIDHLPTISIPGVALGEDGYAEIIFDYDSEWSDLAEDEDPDSNDERYFGNDYPDEEDSEEEYRQFLREDPEDDDYYDSEDDGNIKGKGMNRFTQGAIGSVVRPTYIDEQSLKGMNRTEILQVKSAFHYTPAYNFSTNFTVYERHIHRIYGTKKM